MFTGYMGKACSIVKVNKGKGFEFFLEWSTAFTSVCLSCTPTYFGLSGQPLQSAQINECCSDIHVSSLPRLKGQSLAWNLPDCSSHSGHGVLSPWYPDWRNPLPSDAGEQMALHQDSLTSWWAHFHLLWAGEGEGRVIVKFPTCPFRYKVHL